MSARTFFGRLFDARAAWVTGGLLSLTAALIDLRAGSRLPYLVATCLIAFGLAYTQPKWAWRWTLLVALMLPAVVLVSNRWGPYAIDRFDVFYGLAPAALGTLVAVTWRKLRGGSVTTSP